MTIFRPHEPEDIRARNLAELAAVVGQLDRAAATSVTEHGAKGDGVTDDTAAIQAAIDSGASLVFPEGRYMCAGLTQSADAQKFFATGEVILQKNANGPITTCSGDNVAFHDIKFYGDAAAPTLTGNNIEASGNHFRLINCGSRWAEGRAVLSTGSHLFMLGTNDIYQTADATLSGYDIEVGVSGTASLYHQLIGIYTSQAAGGIKFTDTGSATIVGGQFGKLTIAAGTLPTGVNGGVAFGARILGDVSVDISNAIFAANIFSNVTLTFGAATSGCHFDFSNTCASGFSIVNNGNADNLYNIARAASGASAGIITSGHQYFPHGKGPRFSDSGDLWAAYSDILQSSTELVIRNNITNGQISNYLTAGGVLRALFGGSVKFEALTDKVRLGGSSGPVIAYGAGSPEGAVSAPVGSIFLRTDGGASTSLYVKESGSGNTGWVAK